MVLFTFLLGFNYHHVLYRLTVAKDVEKHLA